MVGMEIAVVFESMYGVTHEIADAIAEGAAEAQPGAHVARLRVGEAEPEQVAAADLLVVGGPTHMRGMSSGMTRKMAVKIEHDKEAEGGTMGHGLEPGAEGDGLRNWFHRLPKATRGRRAAAFDTRGEGPMVGGAAKGIASRLERHGYELVAEPEGFLITGEAGLLKAGERDRARSWGADLVHRATAVTGPRHLPPDPVGHRRPAGRPDRDARPACRDLWPSGPGSSARGPSPHHPPASSWPATERTRW